MRRLLAIALVLLATSAQAQNYLRDDGIFHSVVDGTASGNLLGNSSGLLAPVTVGTGLNLSGGVLSTTAGSAITGLTGDVTATGSGSVPATVVNLPTGVTVAGSLLTTEIAAPGTPAAGKVSIWTDSTDARFHDNNPAGTVGTTVVADTGAANNYVSAISAAGVISKSRPTCASLSDSATGCTTTVGTMATQAASSVAITGGTATGLTGLAIRDTTAAFDVTLAATSTSATLTAGRTQTLDVGNVAHTIKLGTTTNTITFPNLSSYTVITSGDTGSVTNTMLAGSIDLTTKVTNALPGVNGGTGLATAAIGDIMYASATTPTWSRLADVAIGSVLASGGVNTAPAWTVTPTLGVAGTSVGTLAFANVTSGTVKLQPPAGALGSAVLTLPDVTDTLAGFALANGGTNNALTASNGGIVYSDASKLNILAGTVTASQCLLSGSNAAPTWGSCSGAAAVSSVSNSDGTLTISPTTGSVIASLALGHANTWTAAQTFTNSDLLLLGSSTGFTTFTSDNAGASNFTLHFPAANDTLVALAASQTLTNKTLTSPTFGGTVVGAGTIPLSILATQSADTAVVNATGGSASPTAVSIGSCSAASSALTYNTSTHAFGCNSISATGLSSKTGTFTRALSTASNSVAYTGVGFVPTSILFNWSYYSGASSFTGSGFVGSSKAGRANALTMDNTGTSNAAHSDGAFALIMTDDPGLYSFTTAVVASFDSDGFTLTYTKTGTPGATIVVNYIAYR
jgi:hypothetical protein